MCGCMKEAETKMACLEKREVMPKLTPKYGKNYVAEKTKLLAHCLKT